MGGDQKTRPGPGLESEGYAVAEAGQLQMHLSHGNEFFHAGGVGRGTQLSVWPLPPCSSASTHGSGLLPRVWLGK